MTDTEWVLGDIRTRFLYEYMNMSVVYIFKGVQKIFWKEFEYQSQVVSFFVLGLSWTKIYDIVKYDTFVDWVTSHQKTENLEVKI